MKKSDFLKLNPMLLKEVNEPFNSKDYIFEIKFDGTRAMIFINNGEIIIKSRRNVILNNTYPELLEIKNISKDTCILDGEIILLDNGKPSFSKLQERSKLKDKSKIEFMRNNYPVTFICFDILYKNKDLTNIPLIERKKILNTINDTEYFYKSRFFPNKGIDLFNLTKKENLEGIVAKKKNSLYTYAKRTNDWLKIKNFILENFFIFGYIDNPDNYIISLILGETINNINYYVGKVILSKKDPLYKKLKQEKIIKKSILKNFNELATFLKPKYDIPIYYMERTKNNMLRQPFIKK